VLPLLRALDAGLTAHNNAHRNRVDIATYQDVLLRHILHQQRPWNPGARASRATAQRQGKQQKQNHDVVVVVFPIQVFDKVFDNVVELSTLRIGRRAAPFVVTPRASAANSIFFEFGSSSVLTAGQLNLLKADRYVAANRFKLQSGKGPVFEKTWAERKSPLANLQGFRFFSLLRRVEDTHMPASAPPLPPQPACNVDEYDYVSLTIWDDKRGFNAWRTGEAFRGGAVQVDPGMTPLCFNA